MSVENKLYRSFWQREADDSLPRVEILAVGDVMLSREVGRQIIKHGPDYPFARISHVLSRGQVVFGNLECPISSRGTPVPFVQSNFKADPIVVKGLVKAGFKVLSLANNHIYDYGKEAIEDTVNLLKSKGIHVVGIGQSFTEAREPVIIPIADMKIAFLAYTSAHNATDPKHEYVAPPIDLEWLKHDIQKAKSRADICIVSLHFGYENVEYPPPECRKQARKAIEFGADLILGHHPHVIQGMEAYKRGFIAYSLGNFVFDNLTDKKRRSFILKASFNREGIQKIELLPIWINDQYQPEVASKELADSIFAKVKELSWYLKDGSSDKRFWEAAGKVFLSDQKRGLLHSIGRDGVKAVFMRLKHLRIFHLKLLGATILTQIKRIRK
ncbi:MAG TPA: CapA family protein [Desulfobacterales bacterium]|nr:CapA family protein [Desulfobacterales bacterium]